VSPGPRSAPTVSSLLTALAEAATLAEEAACRLRTEAEPHIVASLRTISDRLCMSRGGLLDALDPGRTGSDSVLDGAEADTVPSASGPTLDRVNEEHMAEVERVLFVVSEARRQAERSGRDLIREGAAPHLVAAVQRVERDLEAAIDVFFKGTYFHVPKDQLTLS
jgi:hypothetical protein